MKNKITRIKTNPTEKETKIITGENLLTNPGIIFSNLNFKVSGLLVLTDENVYRLYGKGFIESIRKSGMNVKVSVIPAGENSKDLDRITGYIKPYLKTPVKRDTLFISIGGGVVTDIGGFMSSIILRGLHAVHIPTTLMSQVDAAIGGKTGVDIWKDVNNMQKNIIGTFHNPDLVLCDIGTLKSLPLREISNGTGEIIKYHVGWGKPGISDLSVLKNRHGMFMNIPKLQTLIYGCQKIKSEIVSNDPYEIKGLRQKLNLGHTIGHAIEGSCISRYTHGECVAVGIVGSAYISHLKGFINEHDYLAVVELIRNLNLPVSVSGMDINSVLKNLSYDKKGGKFVLIKNMGQLLTDQDVSGNMIRKALRKVLS